MSGRDEAVHSCFDMSGCERSTLYMARAGCLTKGVGDFLWIGYWASSCWLRLEKMIGFLKRIMKVENENDQR